jgi:hypothetical protein
MNKRAKRLANILELHRFLSHWKLESNGHGHHEFRGLVTFDGSTKASGVTGIKVTNEGFNDGRILLDETSSLSIDHVHLDFDPTPQDYFFHEDDGSLKIKGTSPKMGKYEVAILPVQ